MVTDWNAYVRFRPEFIEVLDPALYSPEWLDAMVFTGQFHLFTAENSAILAAIKVYPTGFKELEGQAAVGNLDEIVRQLIPQAEDFARSQGCSAAVIESRAGWAKTMKRYGYHLHQTAIRKAL